MSFFRRSDRATNAESAEKLGAEISALEKERAESMQALADLEASAQAVEECYAFVKEMSDRRRT